VGWLPDPDNELGLGGTLGPPPPPATGVALKAAGFGGLGGGGPYRDTVPDRLRSDWLTCTGDGCDHFFVSARFRFGVREFHDFKEELNKLRCADS
jgi:hypothetical protein